MMCAAGTVTTQNESRRAASRSIWRRADFQLGMGLLIAGLLPWTTRVWLEIEELGWRGLLNSLAGTAAGLIIGHFAYRRLSQYPGVRGSYPIFPAFAGSYGLVLLAFFFVRLDYSRLHFLTSFLLCVSWYYVLYFKQQRQSLTIGFLPFGNTRSLMAIQSVSWIDLSREPAEGRHVDVIVADLHAALDDRWERFLADHALAGKLVMHVKQMEESLTGRVAIEHLSENNFGSLIPGIIYAKIKRIVDVIVAAVSLPLLLPLFMVLGVAIRVDSPGSIFFYQERMGFRGRPFQMIKFRTMKAMQESGSDPRELARTVDSDARITRFGRFLRRYRLDGLPQVFKWLKGEMSWIGPRPEALPLSRWYEAELPFYRYRHIVRP